MSIATPRAASTSQNLCSLCVKLLRVSDSFPCRGDHNPKNLATNGRHSFLFVAVCADERVIGFVSGELREGSPTFHSKTWASVDDVYVAADHRSMGVGRALLENVRTWARERGADGVSLQVAAANERGRKFYEELG